MKVGKRNVWTQEKVESLAKFCNEGRDAGHTLTWCFTHFPDANSDGDSGRYSATKAAYQIYVKGGGRSRQSASASVAKYSREITLTQILEYQRQAQAAGYQFILR